MKKNFYYLSLMLGLVFGMTMFTACGGGDDGDDPVPVPPTPQPESGEFQGPKRVFGDNLLSSFGEENNSNWYLTYNSDGFVTKIKRESFFNNQLEAVREYEVSYTDKQVTVSRKRSGSERVKEFVITIGANGFAESCTEGYTDSDKKNVSTYEYDSDGHLTKITTTEDDKNPFGGIFTWQNGNIIEEKDFAHMDRPYNYTYTNVGNVAGLQIVAQMGGDMDDLYLPELFYMGLLGKSTANLVQSYSYSNGSESKTGENAWTLDAVGRPTKCVTTTTYPSDGHSYTRTCFWNYK